MRSLIRSLVRIYELVHFCMAAKRSTREKPSPECLVDHVELIRSHEVGLTTSEEGDPTEASVRLCDGRARKRHACSDDALARPIGQVELFEHNERGALFHGLTLLGSLVRRGANSEVLDCAQPRAHCGGRHIVLV